MARIDDVAQEVGIPFRDYNENDAFYVRSCALVKIPHGLLRADGLNQSVVEERFAICILERVARMHPDGVYIWRQTAWEKQDTQHPTTHGVKAEWERCVDAVAGFFFSISGQDVARQWGDVSAELILQRSRAKASGSDAVARWEERRRTSLSEKERQYGSSRTANFPRTADWPNTAAVSAMRMALSAEARLFSREGTGFQIKRTYKALK